MAMLTRRINPDFERSRTELERDAARMRASHKPLARPVLVLAGWRSPHFTPSTLARRLATLTSGRPSDFLVLSYLWTGDFTRAVRQVRRSAQDAFGAATPVDVVAISMGGLVARAAAIAEFDSGPPLLISRLFTLSTPHRGATLARFIRPDDCARVMRPGSTVLSRLDEAMKSMPHEMVCYGQPRDWWIGDATQAPEGRELLWADVDAAAWRLASHFCVNRNRLIIADIARRLRGEPSIRGQSVAPNQSERSG